MKIKFPAVYSLFVGVAVLGMWSLIFFRGEITEGNTEIVFHLVSELLMAAVCIISGMMLLLNKPGAKSFNLAALFMVVYSVLNAAGYYGERGDKTVMTMFLILLVLTLISIIVHITGKPGAAK